MTPEQIEKRREKGRRWYAKHSLDKLVKTKLWRDQNLELAREQTKAWKKLNPDVVSKLDASRRNKVKQASISDKPDKKLIRKIYKEAKKQGKHVDHIIPINGKNVSGLHVSWNLQLLYPLENLEKSNKFLGGHDETQ
jgi:hypothetical protein